MAPNRLDCVKIIELQGELNFVIPIKLSFCQAMKVYDSHGIGADEVIGILFRQQQYKPRIQTPVSIHTL